MRVFYLKISFLHVFLVAMLHMMALSAVMVTTVGFMIKGLLILALLLSAYFQMRYALFLHPDSITFLAKHTNNTWMIRSAHRGFVPVRILPKSIVTRYCIILYAETVLGTSKKINIIPILSGGLLKSDMQTLNFLLSNE